MFTLKKQKLNFAYDIKVSSRARKIQIKIDEGKVILVLPKGVNEKTGLVFLRAKSEWVINSLSKFEKRNHFNYLGSEIKLEALKKLLMPESNLNNSDFYNDWLFQKAEEFLNKRTLELAEKYSFKFNRLKVKRLKTKWGSCSAKKNISLNYKLMKYREEVIDYVIIHELCHLIQMNHSRKFWNLVGEIIPNYKQLRKELKH